MEHGAYKKGIAMGTVHNLLEAKGKRGALDAGLNREVVEAAASYLSDEESGLSFAFSGWAQAALPHRRLPNDQPWQIASERVTLVVEPGRRPTGGGQLLHVGVPFGAHARLILPTCRPKRFEPDLVKFNWGDRFGSG